MNDLNCEWISELTSLVLKLRIKNEYLGHLNGCGRELCKNKGDGFDWLLLVTVCGVTVFIHVIG